MRYVLQVNSKPLAGREDEYNDWYDNTHIKDVLSLPGFNACTRYVHEKPGETPRHIALYEVETDDPDALAKSLTDAIPNMTMSDSFDIRTVSFNFLRTITPRIVAD